MRTLNLGARRDVSEDRAKRSGGVWLVPYHGIRTVKKTWATTTDGSYVAGKENQENP